MINLGPETYENFSKNPPDRNFCIAQHPRHSTTCHFGSDSMIQTGRLEVMCEQSNHFLWECSLFQSGKSVHKSQTQTIRANTFNVREKNKVLM